MSDKTDLSKLKDLALIFLDFEPEPIKEFPVFVTHPFFDSRFTMDSKGATIDICADTEEAKSLKESIKKQILSCCDIATIFSLILPKYHLAFLKYARPYMSKKDFEMQLVESWMITENSNQDVNVRISTLINWFKSADRNYLMTDAEIKYYNSLPDKVCVYRGVATRGVAQDGLSWTCNYNTAKWFAERFNTSESQGYIIKGMIDKKDIFAYLNRRGEDEILCNSKRIYDIERMECR